MTKQIVSICGVVKTSPQEAIVNGIVKTQSYIESYFKKHPIFNEPILRLKKEIDSLQEIASKIPKESLGNKYNLSTEKGLEAFIKHNPQIAKKMLWRILYEMDALCKRARENNFDENYFGLLLFDIYCFNNLFYEAGIDQEE